MQAFFRMEAASGLLLLFCAAGALIWANLDDDSYQAVFNYPLMLGAGDTVQTFRLRDLINDGLMAVFFFLVGMEIKRELVAGELNTVAQASLPVMAAVGGMVVPAAIFLAFNWGGAGERGWGMPMATDIAFSIGVLTLLKDRVSPALVVFLTALAIFDDIGGILVIAFFYGHGLSAAWLLGAAALTLVLLGLNRALCGQRTPLRRPGGRPVVHAPSWWHPRDDLGCRSRADDPARPQRPSREVLGELRDTCPT